MTSFNRFSEGFRAQEEVGWKVDGPKKGAHPASASDITVSLVLPVKGQPIPEWMRPRAHDVQGDNVS